MLRSAHIATICWHRTSSGFFGTRVSSIRPACIPSTTTAHSMRSPRNFGKIRPREGSPTWWPARPMRCSPRATEPGDSTWMTRSIAPMSMPSSSDEVATRQGRSPDFRASSISTRASRLTEPWWARAIGSSASSLSRSARRSASRRLLTNTRVERCARTSSSSSGYTAGQIERGPPSLAPWTSSILTSGIPSGSPRSSSGTTTRRSSSLRTPASTIVTGRSPPTSRATSSSGRWVAERAIRWGSRSHCSASRSSDSIRCAPRLVEATAWISSRITLSTPVSISRWLDVNMR